MSEPPDPTDGGLDVVCSVSGGKDSTALSLWLSSQGIEHRRVFANTGWEHPETVRFVREELPRHIGPIEEVQAERGMADLIRKKGMFPSRLRRFCTTELKIKPIGALIADADGEVINAVGVRAAESKARARLSPWEWMAAFDCWTWRPLLGWSLDDVLAIHLRHRVPLNPLYKLGAERVGCWPCIFSRKAEIRLVSELTPEKIDEIRALEGEVEALARARYAAKGKTLEGEGHHPPTFFRPKHGGGMLPIDDAVAWSRTSRGGRQLQMYSEPSGCMRWGLCDTAGGDRE